MHPRNFIIHFLVAKIVLNTHYTNYFYSPTKLQKLNFK